MSVANRATDARRVVSFVVVLGLVAGLVWAAAQAEGYVTPEPDLHDSGVWVSRADQRRIGRTNTEILAVDTSLSTGSSRFEVLQADAAVFVRQLDPSMLVGVDPVMATTIPGPELPPDTEVELGGGTAAVLDRATGTLIVTSANTLLGVDVVDEEQHTAVFEHAVEITVGVDGTAHAMDLTNGEIHSYDVAGELLGTQQMTLPDGVERAHFAVVGKTPVVLDPSAGQLYLTDQAPIDVTTAGDMPVLQRSGPPTDTVTIVTDRMWIRVPLEGGEPEIVDDNGAGMPATPVIVSGCGYAAWNGNGRVMRACDGHEPEARDWDEFAGGASLTWRVNRERVVLNELETGRQLVFGEGEPVFLDEWAEAFTDEPQETEEAQDTVTQAVEQIRDRGENRPPIANDVVAGTRRGRPVVVWPLRNDYDPDGDVLIISPLKALDPAAGRITLIEDDQAILVELDPGRTQPVSFPYTITDGYGGSASARVTVNTVSEGHNSPPQAFENERTTVVTGGTVVHDVVAGAFDPDGDPISLAGATSDATSRLIHEPDGRLTFTATNEPGEVDVLYTLVDDRGAEGTGLLRVTVVPRDINEPPVARNDYAQTIVDREVVVDLLANDSDANDDPLSLVRVENLTTGTLRWDQLSPEVRFKADAAGTYNFVYRISDGRDTAEGLLRIEVIEPAAGSAPTAVRDDVLLLPDAPAVVDVLANDVDPDGDVLIVTGVTLPTASPVNVQVLQRSHLRIDTRSSLGELVEFDYHITDGTNDATGRVVVTPAPMRERNQPPVVGPDEFTVRAGGIAVLPVLANDYDPDGDPIELLEPDLVDDETAARDGRLFLSDGELRYEAPRMPRGTVMLSTTVMDTAENTASGPLRIEVIDADGERNSAPIPSTLVGRVLAGGRVRIPVPLATMDPEGDIVTLIGITEPPNRGAVVEVGPSEFVYEADTTSAGTDEFEYLVRDQFGAEASGKVLVGIAGLSTSNNAPVAVDDEVNVLPGTSVVVPALANDSDPDGDSISYATEDDAVPVASVGVVELRDGEMHYSAPPDAEVGTATAFAYTITDGRGGRDSATVTIQFVDEIPNRPPEPVDVVVDPQVPETTFTTSPLQADAYDPDDDELTVVSVSRPDAILNPDGSVTMTMPDHPVQFTYVVSDGVEEARAAVIVPLAEAGRPVAVLDKATVEIGGSVTIDVLRNDFHPDERELVLFNIVGVRHGSASIVGDQVEFTASEEGYLGTAGFSYIIVDDPDPAVANRALGTVQVTITGTLDDSREEDIPEDLNTPPEFTHLPIEVPQDTERSVNLAGAVVDPDSGQTHTFSDLRGMTDGISASLAGSALTVRAARNATPGTVVPLTVTVTDGIDSTDGAIDVLVISSERPVPRATPDTARTVQGEPVTIRVLDNDVNPFPDTPLRIVGVTQSAGASVTTDGSVVEFRPDPERRDLGQVRFDYTVQDATGDATRQVTGTVTVTVVGRPDLPAAPTCIGGESRKVQIAWAPPSANGARITQYIIRINEYPTGGGLPRQTERQFSGGSTVQTIDGLTNGRDHTFEVAAINEAVLGEPEFSPASPRCKPDQVPDRPAPPVSSFSDGQLRLTFRRPPVDGSPVTSLILRNTTTGEDVPLGPTVTSYTWTGLENGTSYRFTLQAINAHGESPVSELSTGDGVPAGRPRDVVAPTTEKGDRLLTVNWQRPDENGDPIAEYRITVIRAGVETSKISVPDPTRRSDTLDTDNGVEYQFQLEARNKAGWSTISPRSAPAVSAGRPFPVASVNATEGDRLSQLSFSAPNDNGAAITRYEVSINGGGWAQLADDRIVRNLTNGTDYRLRVRAVNVEGAGDPSPQSNSINPYGRPTTPTGLTSSDGGTRTITWQWNASNGNGRGIARYEVSLNGGGWQSVGGSRSFSHTVAWGGSASLRVRAISTASDPARQVSEIAGPRNHTVPGPRVTAQFSGTYRPCQSNNQVTCQEIRVTLDRFPSNATITVTCYSSEDGYKPYAQHTITTNSNGSGSRVYCHVGSGIDFYARTTSPSVQSNTIRW